MNGWKTRDKTMELKTYLEMLWRRKWIIAIATIAAVAVSIIGTLMVTPVYEATITLRVATGAGEQFNWADIVYADRVMNTYAKLATSSPVLEEVKQHFNLKKKPEVYADVIKESELMQVTVADQTPHLAAQIANTLGEVLIERNKRDRKVRANSISIVELANIPVSPAKPSRELNTLLGLMVGLTSGLGLAFLLENLDTRLYTTAQIEDTTGFPTLGQIPTIESKKANGLRPYQEAFRYLRTTILFSQQKFPLKTLLVTSSVPGEGKSTIAANLAITAAQSGQKVALIDCNLRAPALHKSFDLPNKMGLSNFLRQEAMLSKVMQESKIPGLYVMTGGYVMTSKSSVPKSTQLLDLPRMGSLITQLQQQFDVILLDAPALLTVTDTVALTPIVDGILLVVRRTKTSRETLKIAQKQLTAIRNKPIGIVVNQAERSPGFVPAGKKEKETEPISFIVPEVQTMPNDQPIFLDTNKENAQKSETLRMAMVQANNSPV